MLFSPAKHVGMHEQHQSQKADLHVLVNRVRLLTTASVIENSVKLDDTRPKKIEIKVTQNWIWRDRRHLSLRYPLPPDESWTVPHWS
jgi:hypothetical protein